MNCCTRYLLRVVMVVGRVRAAGNTVADVLKMVIRFKLAREIAN